jgi:urea carboxylase system permease
VLIVFTTVINALGVKLMARINSAGVFIELIAAVLLIILLAVNITRGPDVLFETHGTGEGREWGYLGAFLTASLASAYVMYGFDTASSLGEETLDPRRTAPRAIMRAVVASFILGGLILLFAILSVSDINSPEIAAGGLQFVVVDVLGDTVGKFFLICVAIAVTVCCLAVHTATIRMMFAMARDNNLPAGEKLAKVDPVRKTPIVPAILVGVLALLILAVNIRQPQIFTVITSIGIIMIYVAYLLVTAPMLFSRLRGQWPPKDAREKGWFTLGKLGLPINIIAVLWGAGMAINLAWPRKEVYNATEPFHWYLQYGAILFVGVVFFGGLLYYWLVQRHKTGVLASHAVDSAGEPAPAPATSA